MDALLSQMTSVELTKWVAYFKAKNFLYQRDAQVRQSEMNVRSRRGRY